MEHEQDREALLRRYIELKEKAKQLEAEIESLKSNLFDVISDMQDEAGKKQLLFEDYVFTINYRKTYDYPPHIKKMEEKLKSLKKEAEASGEAILKSDSGYVVLKKVAGNRDLA
jgi:predicted RNase H-like nuclease (RuvC/YqgF family)